VRRAIAAAQLLFVPAFLSQQVLSAVIAGGIVLIYFACEGGGGCGLNEWRSVGTG